MIRAWLVEWGNGLEAIKASYHAAWTHLKEFEKKTSHSRYREIDGTIIAYDRDGNQVGTIREVKL